ncbi:MAG: hypothetical protein AAGF25_15365 [Pseudomonadota bacterium]
MERTKAEGIAPFIFQIAGNSFAEPYCEEYAAENYFEISNVPQFENAFGELDKIGGNGMFG